MPLSEKPLAFLDSETTGLTPGKHEVIEVAVLVQHCGGAVEEWCTKVRPIRLETADPKALEVNGYAAHPELWALAPTFAEIAEELALRLDGSILVGHNIGFDAAFLQEEFFRCGSTFRLPHRRLDTYTLAYEHLAHRGLESLSLNAVCSFMGVSNENSHTALADAKRCREVWNGLARPR